MPNLTSFEALVSVASERTVKLSPGSLTVLLSALDLIADHRQWQGSGDNFELTGNEADRVDGYTDLAIYEILRTVTVKHIGEPFSLFVPDAPDGAIPMDGTSRLQSQYPELMSKIPESWKAGLFFTVPDMSGRTIVGEGFNYRPQTGAIDPIVAGDTGGETERVMSVAEMPAHEHGISKNYDPAPRASNRISWSLGTTTSGYEATLSQQSGLSQPYNNMPPFLAAHWFIQAE